MLLLFGVGFLCKDNYVYVIDCDLECDDDEDDVTQWVVCGNPSHANTRPIYQCAAATQATAPFSSQTLTSDPPAPPVEKDPLQTLHLLSFRRGGGKLFVCEHGVERVDLPGDPLPEGPHILLVALLLLVLPSPVTTSSDVFEISGKVMTVVGTPKNWATTL